MLLDRLEQERLSATPVHSRGLKSGKTSRAAAKRFRLTGSGQIRRNFAGRRHKLWNKGRAHVNRLGGAAFVHTADAKNVKTLLGQRGRA